MPSSVGLLPRVECQNGRASGTGSPRWRKDTEPFFRPLPPERSSPFARQDETDNNLVPGGTPVHADARYGFARRGSAVVISPRDYQKYQTQATARRRSLEVAGPEGPDL